MKSKFLIILLIISFTSSSKVNSEISHLLWSQNLLGEISQISSANLETEDLIITSSKSGAVNVIDSNTKELKFRKLFNSKFLKISANLKSMLVFNNEDLLENIFSLDSNQLLISNPHLTKIETDTPIAVRTDSVHLKNNLNLHFVISQKRFQIINENNVIYDSKVKENVEYYDYFIDEQMNKLSICYKNISEIIIAETPLDNISKKNKVINQRISINEESFKNCFITQNYVYILEKNNHLKIYENGKDKTEIIKSLNLSEQEILDIIKYPIYDSLVILHEKSAEIISKGEIAKTIAKAFKVCKISKLENALVCQDSRDLYDFTKLYFNANNGFDKEESLKIKIKEEEIKDYAINQKNPNTYFIATNKGLYKYNILKPEKIIPIFENKMNSIIFNEIIAFENDLKKESQTQQKFMPISAFSIASIGFPIKNIITNLIEDILEISKKLSDSLNFFFTLIQNKGELKEIKNNQSIFSYSLFIYTKENDFYVLDALNGKTLFYRKMENGLTLLKINKNIKDKIIHSHNDKQLELIFKDINGKNKSFLFNLEKNILTENQNEFEYNEIIKENIKRIEKELVESNNKKVNHNLTKRIQTILKAEFSQNLENKLNELADKYTIEQYNNCLYGFKFSLNKDKEIEMNIIYNFNFEQIIKVDIINVNANAVPTYLVSGKIFYKFLNENLITVLSKQEEKNLLLTIINGENGKILKQIVINSVDFTTLSFVLEDNWAILSYVKQEKGFKRNEIFSLEILSKKIDGSLKILFEKKLKDKSTTLVNSNDYENDIEILYHSFAIERTVKKLFKSQSEFNNANKFLVFLLKNNNIFLIDRRTFSPRRPLPKETPGKENAAQEINSIYVDNELPPYLGLLSFDYKLALEMNPDYSNIDQILITPTESESTFILCSIGEDLKCYKVFPDKEYDRLNSAFSYPLILLFLAFSAIITYILRKYEKRVEGRKAFLTS